MRQRMIVSFVTEDMIMPKVQGKEEVKHSIHRKMVRRSPSPPKEVRTRIQRTFKAGLRQAREGLEYG